MNATSSGVAFSAAKIRSPSFSRSSSSMTTTALPAAMSATARSTESSLVILTTLPVPTRETTYVPFSMNHGAARVIARLSEAAILPAMTPTAALTIGSVVFDDVDQIDVTGPYEVLASLPYVTYTTYGLTTEPVRDYRGLRLLPDAV